MKTAEVCFAAALIVGLFSGCGAGTARDWSKCSPSALCKPGFTCTPDNRCVEVPDAQPDTLVIATDSMVATPDSPVGAIDAIGIDTLSEPDAPVTPSQIDAPLAIDLAKDVFIEECQSSAECKDPGRAFCVGGVCTGCDHAGYGACPGKVCAPSGTPVVGGQCVGCVTSSDCTSATAPICLGNACVACSNPSQCAAKSSSTPACLTSTGACVACINDTTCPPGGFSHCDVKTNTCVGCSTSVDCMGNTPICTAGVCGKCVTNAQCAGRDSTRPMCVNDSCVQCSTNSDCGGAKPYCDSVTKTCMACLTSQNCPDSAPICEGGVCAKCTEASGKCSSRNPTLPACSASGKCVQCTELSNTCSGATPACHTDASLCVQCVNNSTCGASSPVCDVAAKTCVQCLAHTDCAGLANPLCDTKTKKCVECLEDAGCGRDPKKPLCSNGVCTACTAGDRCGKKSAATPACVLSGAEAGTCVQCTDKSTCTVAPALTCNTSSNKCVECVASSDCKDANKPICGGDNRCKACTPGGSECGLKNPATPACAARGACVQCTDNSGCTAPMKCRVAINSCVECLDNSGCGGNKPICDASNTCQACTADAQCGNPGVCMSHQDGRCASEAESIVFTLGVGMPTPADLVGKRLLVVRGGIRGNMELDLTGKPQLTMVGQNSGTMTGLDDEPVIKVAGGDLYVRDLKVTGPGAGFSATGDGVLRLKRVTVDGLSLTGTGIQIIGSGFDIRDTTVKGYWDGIALGNIGHANPGSPRELAFCGITGNAQYGVDCREGSDTPTNATGILTSANTVSDFSSACDSSVLRSCGSTPTADCGPKP